MLLFLLKNILKVSLAIETTRNILHSYNFNQPFIPESY